MDVFTTVLRLTDDAVPRILALRQTNPAKRDYHGQMSPEKGYAEPNHSAGAADTLLSAYFCKASRWHGDTALLSAAIDALEFLCAHCHEDGSIDLVETNFHDCTSNSFAVQILGYTYRLLEREAKTENELRAKALARSFLETTVRAVATGGFHTPNHRWVITSAMALCYRSLGNDKCLDIAKTYLSEGIDCNEEGDYTERSVGIYDVTNNESLTIIAQELDMPELYQAVERNLEKNWYYIEPDMTGLTLASRRQDYGKEASMVRHFYTCYQTAARTGSPRFAYMANRLLEQMERQRAAIGTPQEIYASLSHQNLLTRLMLTPPPPLAAEEPMPLCYDRHFESIGVARHREGNWTCSLLRDNSTFMKVQYGGLKAYFKLACTFFQFGRLVATRIDKTPGGYRLSCEQEWGYVRPLPGIQQPDWWKIDRSLREKANWQHHRWQVDVAFTKSGLTLHIGTEGTPGIPAKLECILPPGGLVHSGRLTVPAQPGGWLIAGQDASYNRGGEVMRLCGGFSLHNYAPNMRNSDPQPADQFCLYCTDFTPMDRQLEISFDTAP